MQRKCAKIFAAFMYRFNFMTTFLSVRALTPPCGVLGCCKLGIIRACSILAVVEKVKMCSACQWSSSKIQRLSSDFFFPSLGPSWTNKKGSDRIFLRPQMSLPK